MRERKEENKQSGKPRRGRWSQSEIARLKELYGLRDDAAIARDLNRPPASVRKMAEKLFPPCDEERPWTPEEVERLKEYLGASKPDVIARVLRRRTADVVAQITELRTVRRTEPWSRDDVARFKKIYGTRDDVDLAVVFGRSEEDVRKLAAKYKLAKDKAYRRKKEGEAATRMPRWSAAEVEILKQMYPDEANLDIAQRLDRTVKSVVSKAHNLGLKKSNERLQRMGRENVSLRYSDDPDAVVRGEGERIVELPAAPPRETVVDGTGVPTAQGSEQDVVIPRPERSPVEPRLGEDDDA